MASTNQWHYTLAVTNRHLCQRPFLEQIERICRLHPKAILLREKDLPKDDYQTLAREVLRLCQVYQVPCILHTYEKAARELSCPAIHLPLPLLREAGPRRKDFSIIGASIHSPGEAREAKALGATYLTAGHIYATDCKKGLPPRGLPFLKEVCQAVDLPVYAIGGISPNPRQIEEILACGAAGGCMMSYMMKV